jgi:NIPSNAP
MSGLEAVDVVELRRYTLVAGERETLIALFEGELIEPQEAAGMRVLGQFRDVDDPDAFVWLRGFADMRARRNALEAFYGGPVWARHRDAANATMLDSDDVLLLRPTGALGAPPSGGGTRVVIVTYPLTALPPADLLAAWRAGTAERIAAAGGALQATLVTETQANDFAQLPVREDERVAVTIMGGDTDPSAHEAPELQAFRTPAHPVLSRLEPTDRSAWRG